jgi:hypothetical protein
MAKKSNKEVDKPDNTGQWKPGQSGNPAGRPPNVPLITPAMRRLLAMSETELKRFRPTTVAELIAVRQVMPLLVDDDYKRFSAIMERLEEKPKQVMEIDQPKEFILKIESDEADV